MKRIIRLTERDLTRLVRRIVEETESESKGVSKKGSLKDIAKKKFVHKEDFMDIYNMTQKDNSEWKIISVDSGAIVAGSSKNLEGKIIKSSDFINLTNGGGVTLKPRKTEIDAVLWVKLGSDDSIQCVMIWD
jgi:hypothetical protein